jgi:hypothetical protein
MDNRIGLAWCQTVGAMLDTPGCSVRVTCEKCGLDRPVDLQAVAKRRGRDFSLINVRCPCPCGHWVRFIGACGRGAWMHALHDEAHGFLWAAGIPLEKTYAAQRQRRK